MDKDPFTVTEIIKLPSVRFAFSKFSEVAVNLRSALKDGIIERGKRYELVLKEIR